MCKCVVVDNDTQSRTETTGCIEKFTNLSFVKSFSTLQKAIGLFDEQHIDFLFLHATDMLLVKENSDLLLKLRNAGTRIVFVSKKFSILRQSASIANDLIMKPLTALRVRQTFTKGEGKHTA